jgi:NitT/TauT family transport system ATP-binding protein
VTLTAARLPLRAEGVQVVYVDPNTKERFVAVERIDLEIREGEFVSLVGPSGCGKSTFLKVVNGLIPAAAGTVEVTQRSNGRAHAMVFQDSALFPWYTVLSNVAYGLICQGVPKKEAQERARPLIRLVGLADFENKYPHQLSGGMQQRANLARALAVDPEILLMDEPFASLDAQTRELMQHELLRIWTEARKTVLFVTHQIDEAVYLSDRVVVMSASPGRIIADIPVALPRPRHLEIKRTPEFVAYVDRIWRLIRPHLGSSDVREA